MNHLAPPAEVELPCRIVDATPDRIIQLFAKPLRVHEALNWSTTTGRHPGMVLRQMRKQDRPARIKALLNDHSECICLWAVDEMLGSGCLWVLAAQEAAELSPDVSAYLAQDLSAIQEQYALLTAHAHEDDMQLGGWLGTIGFVPCGLHRVGGEPFTTFVKRQQV